MLIGEAGYGGDRKWANYVILFADFALWPSRSSYIRPGDTGRASFKGARRHRCSFWLIALARGSSHDSSRHQISSFIISITSLSSNFINFPFLLVDAHLSACLGILPFPSVRYITAASLTSYCPLHLRNRRTHRGSGNFSPFFLPLNLQTAFVQYPYQQASRISTFCSKPNKRLSPP